MQHKGSTASSLDAGIAHHIDDQPSRQADESSAGALADDSAQRVSAPCSTPSNNNTVVVLKRARDADASSQPHSGTKCRVAPRSGIPPRRIIGIGSIDGVQMWAGPGCTAQDWPPTICTPIRRAGSTVPFCSLQALGRDKRILYLYAGRCRTYDAVHLGSYIGATVDAIDIERHSSHDLSDQAIWEDVVCSLGSGYYDAVLLSPPCSTFSCSRSQAGGPKPLRGDTAPAIYGLPDLAPKDKEAVRMGTLLAARAAEAADICMRVGLPWILETPRMRHLQPSVLKLPEWTRILALAGVQVTNTDQCQFNDHPVRHEALVFKKSTALASNFSLAGLERKCGCTPVVWFMPNGSQVTTPHPPLRGTVPARRKGATGSQPEHPKGQFLTRATAHYPAELTWQLISALVLQTGSATP